VVRIEILAFDCHGFPGLCVQLYPVVHPFDSGCLMRHPDSIKVVVLLPLLYEMEKMLPPAGKPVSHR
jgi:hypothetical protein